jgi:hypothetical protein
MRGRPAYFEIRSSTLNGRESPMVIFEKSAWVGAWVGLITRLCSSGMIAEGTLSSLEIVQRPPGRVPA